MTAFLIVIVTPAAETTRTQWAITEETCLSALQAAVHGYVDVVRLNDTLDMWVNEEGLFTEPLNPLASAIAAVYSARSRTPRQPYFYGTVVFTGGADDEGATRPLEPAQADELLALSRRLLAA